MYQVLSWFVFILACFQMAHHGTSPLPIPIVISIHIPPPSCQNALFYASEEAQNASIRTSLLKYLCLDLVLQQDSFSNLTVQLFSPLLCISNGLISEQCSSMRTFWCSKYLLFLIFWSPPPSPLTLAPSSLFCSHSESSTAISLSPKAYEIQQKQMGALFPLSAKFEKGFLLLFVLSP